MPYDSGPVIAVTQFACRSRAELAWVARLHARFARRIRLKVGEALLGDAQIADRPRLAYVNLTVWSTLEGVRAMGHSDLHVRLVKTVVARGIPVHGGIFSYTGDWRTLLFGVEGKPTNPLLSWQTPGSPPGLH